MCSWDYVKWMRFVSLCGTITGLVSLCVLLYGLKINHDIWVSVGALGGVLGWTLTLATQMALCKDRSNFEPEFIPPIVMAV